MMLPDRRCGYRQCHRRRRWAENVVRHPDHLRYGHRWGAVHGRSSAGTYGSVTIDAAGNWTYTLDNANADVQALPLNATMNDIVTVSAIDGTTHDITITITGTNDAAVVGGVDTGGVTEDGGALQVTTGTLTISDVDTGEELFTVGGQPAPMAL